MELENRYLVIKRKHLELLTPEAKEELENIVTAISISRQPDIDTGADGEIDCVVIEKDWPEFKPVLKMLSDRVDKESNT